MKKVFVTGATGTIGREVVRALGAYPAVTVTAASRSAATPFDYADPATFSAADGHEAVFVLAPPLDPAAHTLILPFLRYLAAGERPRVTYLSALGMEELPELPLHREVEAYLRGSELEWTVLRPGFFASNFGSYERENIEQRGVVYNPAGTGKTAFIDPQDVGRVAALTLTQAGHAGQTYELTGPVAYGMHEAAALIGARLGRPIAYPAPSDADYRAALAAAGAPGFVADYMIAVYGLIRNGRVSTPTGTVERLTGHPATELRAVIARDFG